MNQIRLFCSKNRGRRRLREELGSGRKNAQTMYLRRFNLPAFKIWDRIRMWMLCGWVTY